VTLYVLWRIEHMESQFRYICRSEIAEDDAFMTGMSAAELDSGLEKAVKRGSLLRVENSEGGFYFLNSPRGRANAEAMRKGNWRASARSSPSTPPPERPNIFKLYEENIGPLTPLIADALKEAEAEYPPEWIEEALDEAVKRNKRNWKYVDAILRGWMERGKNERKDKHDTNKDSERYSKSAFSEYFDQE
jgi:DNA replication protein